MNPTRPRIGIIGIGAMGLPIARNLHARDWPVRVRDIDPAPVAAAAALGIESRETPAALAQACDVIVLVVVDAPQIEAVLFGADGVVQAAPQARDASLAVLVCSTIAAQDTEDFARRLAPHGIDLLDAPISGGPARAADGSMSMMLAGAPELLARLEPLLGDMAARRFPISERPGDAARTKLVNNLLAGVNLVAAAEALALGARLGLDRRALLEVIAASSGASWIGQERMARALQGDFAPRARAAILTKDVGLAVGMAHDAGIDTPLGSAALDVFKATLAAGMADLDDAAVVRTIWPGF